MRILVSGGGTAGHVSPILATVAALRSLDSSVELLYVGQHSGLEARIATASGLEYAGISAGKFRRGHGGGWTGQLAHPLTALLNLRDLLRVGLGVLQSRRIIREFKPDVIFIKGGYVGLPVGLAARQLGVPYVVHESDLEPGLANRILAPGAAAVAVGFPAEHYHKWQLARPPVFTGSPIRPELLTHHRLEGVMHFTLRPELPVLLVTGGSQGAVALNSAVLEVLPKLLEQTQVIHLTGEGDIDRVRFEARRLKLDDDGRYRIAPFLLNDMGLALAAADVVVARSGATTIAELAALVKPTILVPNDQMAGHQIANAQLLGRADAARILPPERLTGGRLLYEVTKILGDPAEQDRLARAIAKFAQPDAARQLAKLILAAAAPEGS